MAGSPAQPFASAGLWRRFMSTAYESLVLFAVAIFFGYAFSALTQYRGEAGVMRHAFQAFLFLVFGGYFTWFWSGGRRSLPMKTVSVRLINARGHPLSRVQAALRYVIAAACVLIPVWAAQQISPWTLVLVPLAWLWAVVDPASQTLYDRLAATRLVIDESPKP